MRASIAAILLTVTFAAVLLAGFMRDTREKSAAGWQQSQRREPSEQLKGPLHLGECSVPLSADTIASRKHLRHMTLYRTRDVYNHTNYLRIECVPKLAHFNYGAHALGEVLTDAVVKLLQLPVAVPCVDSFILPAHIISSSGSQDSYPLHDRCIFKRGKEKVVFGALLGSAADDLVEGQPVKQLHQHIDPRWGSLFRQQPAAPREQNASHTALRTRGGSAQTTHSDVHLSDDEKLKLADVSNIMLLDYIVANTDRGYSKNWFFSPSLGRFIAVDNGYFFGPASVCSPEFGRARLDCPPLLHYFFRTDPSAAVNDSSIQATPGKSQTALLCGDYHNCVFSRTAVRRLEENQQQLSQGLRTALSTSGWFREFERLDRTGQLRAPGPNLLRRPLSGCPFDDAKLSLDGALDLVVQSTVDRLQTALHHISHCRQQFGDEYVLQLP